MSGSIVTIRVNGNPYQMGCDKGQEAEIEALGKLVDKTVSDLVQSVGQIGETRLLVMAALLLAEKSVAAGSGETMSETASEPQSQKSDSLSDAQLERLEKLAQSISALAASVKSS